MSKAIWGKYKQKGARVLLILDKVKFKVIKTHESSRKVHFIFIKYII